MELLNWLIAVLKTVPTWVWIVALICICVPTISYALKRSLKVVGWVCLVAIIIFVCPSIVTSFMNATGLTYDPDTKQLMNSAGQKITLALPDGTSMDLELPDGEQLMTSGTDLVKKAQAIIKSFDIEELKSDDFTAEDLQLKWYNATGTTMDYVEAEALLKLIKTALK